MRKLEKNLRVLVFSPIFEPPFWIFILEIKFYSFCHDIPDQRLRKLLKTNLQEKLAYRKMCISNPQCECSSRCYIYFINLNGSNFARKNHRCLFKNLFDRIIVVFNDAARKEYPKHLEHFVSNLKNIKK